MTRFVTVKYWHTRRTGVSRVGTDTAGVLGIPTMISLKLALLARVDLDTARSVYRAVCWTLWDDAAHRVGYVTVNTEPFDTWFEAEWGRVQYLDEEVDAELVRQGILDHVLSLAVAVDDLNEALRNGEEDCD